MTAPPRALPVGPEDTGMRLDVFLAEKLALSRAQARRLLARGAVRVAGRAVAERAKGERLASGTTVEVDPFTRSEDQRAVPDPDRALAVLAEGEGWIALDKPAGVPVHPLREDETGTLLNALVARTPAVHGVGEGGLRSGVVHRLDVDTSGVILFATTEPVWRELRAAFAEHRVDKRYRAVVLGEPPEEGESRVGLVVARHRPARVRVVGEDERARGAREASTRWRTLDRFAGAALVEARPVSGHLHQIRATFAHLGFPVAGDRVYGPASDPTGAARQMLHAAHVATGEVAAASPDPPDFAELAARLRKESAA